MPGYISEPGSFGAFDASYTSHTALFCAVFFPSGSVIFSRLTFFLPLRLFKKGEYFQFFSSGPRFGLLFSFRTSLPVFFHFFFLTLLLEMQ